MNTAVVMRKHRKTGQDIENLYAVVQKQHEIFELTKENIKVFRNNRDVEMRFMERNLDLSELDQARLRDIRKRAEKMDAEVDASIKKTEADIVMTLNELWDVKYEHDCVDIESVSTLSVVRK
jgi:hypothetical protein